MVDNGNSFGDMEWDLSVIYPSLTDPAIDRDLESAKKRVIAIAEKYRNNVNSESMDARQLIDLINEQEAISTIVADIGIFSYLSVSVDETNKEGHELRNKLQLFSHEMNQLLSFLTLEIGELIKNRGVEFLEAEELKPKKHYLEKLYRAHQYRLSEAEELIMMDKNQYGNTGWMNLQSNWLATRMFKVEIEGETKEMSWSESASLSAHPKQEVRREFITKVLGGLGQDQELYASILRNICGDHVLDTKRRGYPSTRESNLIYNDVTQEIIDVMFDSVKNHVPLHEEYLQTMAGLFGTSVLNGEDYSAPPPFQAKTEFTWQEAKEIIITNYTEFDPEIGNIVSFMFNNHRIDSLPRKTKASGAFCTPFYKGKSAFILQSYSKTISDVSTTAHELGHAIQDYLMHEEQTMYNTFIPNVLAEAAGEFCSILFAKTLLSSLDGEEDKKAIRYGLLQNLFITIFEVGSRYIFENKLYDAIEKGLYLNGERITELLWEARGEYYGKSLNWMPEQAYHWCWKSHYYIAGYRFYNYPYVFSELLAIALYNLYARDGKEFVPKFKAFLAAGSSKSPYDILIKLGIDITSKEFWDGGFNLLSEMLKEFKDSL